MNQPAAAAIEPREGPNGVLDRIRQHLTAQPYLKHRFFVEMLMLLHKRGIASMDDLQDQARARIGRERQQIFDDPNQAERDRWDELERDAIDDIALEMAGKHLSVPDVDEVVNITVKRDKVQTLEAVVNRSALTFRELREQLQTFCEIPQGETRLLPAEVVGTRVALARHLLSDQLEFLGIAKHHLTIRNFHDVVQRIIGTDDGMGRVGGKAAGMILAYHILAAGEKEGEVFLPLAVPESYYLRSDAVQEFLRLNRLDQYQSQKYKSIDDLTRDFTMIKGVFRNGDFPLRIVHGLRQILERLGTHPLIVRSSSLLEDRFGTAFSGKYASVFVPNQGNPEQRLRALLGAIAEVYASVMAPDPIVYRNEHGLIDYVEEMAVLIQKVVGFKFGDYFLPSFAGVAFSQNEYRWSPRIHREDGLVRLVMGLGTRAVDRGGADYPRMVALGAPTLRPESTVQEIMRGAQQMVDVVDLKKNRLQAIRVSELLAAAGDFPWLDRIVSVYQDDELYTPTGLSVDADPSRLHVTFDKLLRGTPFAQRILGLLRRLEKAYGSPVDMEFACDGEKLYVLQCRTQSQARVSGPVRIPHDIPPEDVVFDAHRYVRTGLIEGMETIVYVDPMAYDALPTREQRIELARVIGRLNHKLERRKFILIGPGRWGSNDIRLGVPVRYADINRCRMLIEVARRKDGFQPEVSFGTHFFQDLVEADIHYLPLYPDETGNRFNEAFMQQAENALTNLLPDDREFAPVLRVIPIPAVASGRKLNIVMDGDADHALAYLL